MHLTAFRVFKYRNIQDSGLVQLADQLTCIVGKNQSGKTNLLKALQKLNPHDKSVKYDQRSDWPRGERRAKDQSQIVCEAHFELDAEKEELAGLTDVPLRTAKVVVTKNYAGEFEVAFPEQPDLFPNYPRSAEADRICEKLNFPNPTLGEKFIQTADECREEARRIARQGDFSELAALTGPHRDKLELARSFEQELNQNEGDYILRYVDLLGQVRNELAAHITVRTRANDYIISHLPTFIYMDDYRSFEGAANLDQVLLRADEPTAQDDTLMMIFALAGLDLKKLVEQGRSGDPGTLRDRQYDLQDAAETLSKAVAGRWAQNPYRVQFRADGQRFFTEIEEIKRNVGMLPLEEQSKGFQWFFSFDLRFMHDSGGTFAGCVLLLDEPGLHLHPGGQDDLLRRFDAYARDNTLIYTTHLPFLVDLREPRRIHVLIERPDRSASVSDDLAASGPDERQTLQAALGMKALQHHFVAQKNLVVAGPAEHAILSDLSNLLERSGKSGLAEDIAITAAGNASEVVPVATFMVGEGLKVVALFDSDGEGKAQEIILRAKWLARYKNVPAWTVLLNDAFGLPGEVGIEDVFSESYYLAKAIEAHAAQLTRAVIKSLEPTGPGTLAARVARSFAAAGVTFDKGAVLKLIRKELRELRSVPYLSDLGRGTADKAERLFDLINSRLAA
jgi:energy-coupling factor transporter ATP-binding protein EcfA2